MQLKWEKRAVEQDDTVIHEDIMKEKGPYELFADFYELVTGKAMTERAGGRDAGDRRAGRGGGS